MTPFPTTLLLALALAPLQAAPGPSGSPALQPQAGPAEPDWFSIVGLYPQPGTPEAQAEPPVLAWLQMSRTADDVARARSEQHPSLGCWADLLGPGFSVADHPLTAALLRQAKEDLRPILGMLKNVYHRPRPSEVIPSLSPVLPLQTELPWLGVPSSSYPSSHAALGVVYAQIIHQFAPAARPAIAERGALIGTDRVLGGVHWPSDVAAGQRLGRAFATWWIGQPEHRARIMEACKAEWHSNARREGVGNQPQ